jgi:hypothetical protein
MKKRTKRMLMRIAALIVAVALVIVGGYFERGYYWPAAEILLIPLGIGWIAYKQKEESE